MGEDHYGFHAIRPSFRRISFTYTASSFLGKEDAFEVDSAGSVTRAYVSVEGAAEGLGSTATVDISSKRIRLASDCGWFWTDGIQRPVAFRRRPLRPRCSG